MVAILECRHVRVESVLVRKLFPVFARCQELSFPIGDIFESVPFDTMLTSYNHIWKFLAIVQVESDFSQHSSAMHSHYWVGYKVIEKKRSFYRAFAEGSRSFFVSSFLILETEAQTCGIVVMQLAANTWIVKFKLLEFGLVVENKNHKNRRVHEERVVGFLNFFKNLSVLSVQTLG